MVTIHTKPLRFIVLLIMTIALLWFLLLAKLHYQSASLLLPSLACSGHDDDCQLIRETIASLPKQCQSAIHSASIRYDDPTLGGFTTTYGDMWLAGDLSRDEFRAMIVHEFGHITDFLCITGSPRTGGSVFTVLTMPTFSDDPSLDFYTLSWTDPVTQKHTAKPQDFVSTYAQVSAIEDFAETYAYYVLQRDAFASRARTNAVLKKKYAFMKQLFPAGFSIASGSSSVSAMPDTVMGLAYDWRGK